MKDILVILDNGHGKETPGKRSPLWSDGTQLFEWEYTRKVVKEVSKRLTNCGVDNYILVPGESSPSLSVRAQQVNELVKKQSCILVSVHCNAGGGTGWEIWTTTKKNNSDKLAQCFIDTYKEQFPNWNTKGHIEKLRGHKEKDWTLLYLSNCPCVLTENWFMDTESNCKWLLSEEGFNQVCTLHVNAIKKYLE